MSFGRKDWRLTCPLVYARQGAEQVLLDGVFHSMSQIGSYSKAGDHVWYGDERVVDTWLPHLVTV